jgi:hypothetical protein
MGAPTIEWRRWRVLTEPMKPMCSEPDCMKRAIAVESIKWSMGGVAFYYYCPEHLEERELSK